jgi:hypothetical protein
MHGNAAPPVSLSRTSRKKPTIPAQPCGQRNNVDPYVTSAALELHGEANQTNLVKGFLQWDIIFALQS